MAGQSVGQVQLDLLLNSSAFRSQLQGAVNQAVSQTSSGISSKVGSTFSKLGKLAIAAFSVKAIAGFVSSSIELGSTLQEVQNVVDSTFTTMNEDVNEFAKTAIKNFGLSEAKTKQYVGTMGAMAKSFGFTEKEAYNMSTTLTKLVGDVGSFYNLDSDTAYTKLKGVFTGETEALKDLGIVMTQTALDEYALAKGYGKTTSAMSEQEKVALRYAFVQDQLTTATGDFIRTQKGWANQTRILSLQWDSLKANLGQAFISLLTPLIQMLNLLVEKLVIASEAFKNFVEGIFGAQESAGSGSMANLTEDVNNVEDGLKGATGAAQKMKKSLMGFDNLNVLPDNSSAGSGTGSTTSVPTASDENAEAAEKTEKETSKLLQTIKELAAIAKAGFLDGLNGKSAETTIANLKNIGSGLKEIATDAQVVGAARTYVESIITSLSTATGAIASMGITLGELITGSFSKFIDGRKGNIKQTLVDLFDIGTEISKIQTDWAKAVANIFSVFSGEEATGLLSNILNIFYDLGEGVYKLGARIARDATSLITTPIVKNQEKIKKALNGLLKAYNTVYSAISEVVREFVDGVIELYDKHVKPLVDSVIDGLSDIVSTFLDSWNTYMQPVIDKMADKISELWTQYISPIAQKIIKIVGSIMDILKVLWDNVLQPLIKFIVSVIVPTVATALDAIWYCVSKIIGMILGVIDGLLKTLGGLIDFIAGVFTGDWDRAWNGIKDIFSGVWDAIYSVFGWAIEGIKSVWQSVSSWFVEKLTAFKDTFINIFTNIKDGIVGVFDMIKTAVKTPINAIIGMINRMISGINSLSFNIPDWVPEIGGQKFGFNIPKIPLLAEGGYVKPNTPQLAMIGDNRHQGEIVAPEGKLHETVAANVKPILTTLQQLMSILVSQGQNGGGDITIPIYLDGRVLDEYVLTAQDRKTLRSGGMA